MDRNVIKSGPAVLTWNAATLYFKDGITIAEEGSTYNVEADAFAGGDVRRSDRKVVITGTPAGQWKDLGVLFPWLSASPGARLHGATDKAAVIHFLDGDKFTYHNAALAKMPSLMFSPTKTLLGSVEFRARTKNNTAASAAASLFTRASEAFADTSFDWADVLTQAYTLNFGASPWDAFDTLDGVEITPSITWREISTDALGVVDEELQMVEVVSRFTPIGIAQASIDSKMALQAVASAARGARLSAIASDFVLTGTDVHVIQRSAIMRAAQLRAGRGVERHGAVELVSTLGITTGAAVAQLYVNTEAPA